MSTILRRAIIENLPRAPRITEIYYSSEQRDRQARDTVLLHLLPVVSTRRLLSALAPYVLEDDHHQPRLVEEMDPALWGDLDGVVLSVQSSSKWWVSVDTLLLLTSFSSATTAYVRRLRLREELSSNLLCARSRDEEQVVDAVARSLRGMPYLAELSLSSGEPPSSDADLSFGAERVVAMRAALAALRNGADHRGLISLVVDDNVLNDKKVGSFYVDLLNAASSKGTLRHLYLRLECDSFSFYKALLISPAAIPDAISKLDSFVYASLSAPSAPAVAGCTRIAQRCHEKILSSGFLGSHLSLPFLSEEQAMCNAPRAQHLTIGASADLHGDRGDSAQFSMEWLLNAPVSFPTLRSLDTSCGFEVSVRFTPLPKSSEQDDQEEGIFLDALTGPTCLWSRTLVALRLDGDGLPVFAVDSFLINCVAAHMPSLVDLRIARSGARSVQESAIVEIAHGCKRLRYLQILDSVETLGDVGFKAIADNLSELSVLRVGSMTNNAANTARWSRVTDVGILSLVEKKIPLRSFACSCAAVTELSLVPFFEQIGLKLTDFSFCGSPQSVEVFEAMAKHCRSLTCLVAPRSFRNVSPAVIGRVSDAVCELTARNPELKYCDLPSQVNHLKLSGEVTDDVKKLRRDLEEEDLKKMRCLL